MTQGQPVHAAAYKKWLDELTVELRINNVSGKSIGDMLASVEEFLADSGQSPQQAFGEPRSYALQLATAQPPAERGEPGWSGYRVRVGGSATSLVAFLAFSAALTPWLQGGPLLLGGWQLLLLAMLGALVLALPLYLPWLLRHFWAMLTLPLVGAAAGLLGTWLTPASTDGALLVLAPAVVLVFSVAVLLALSAFGTVSTLREKPDHIVKPLNGGDSRQSRWPELLVQWLFPLLALLMLGLTTVVEAAI